jgi:hypothetical protein
MSPYQTNRELLFLENDWCWPRWYVERNKLAQAFPGLYVYAVGDQITSVQGNLWTSYGNQYYVTIGIPDGYPYDMPTVSLPYAYIDPDCTHVYSNGNICVMKSDQWSSTMSIAFLVAKVAVWVNKYDSWVCNGKARWPGSDQHNR